MALWEIFIVTAASACAVFNVPYDGSWICMGLAFTSSVVAAIASAYALFYCPLVWAALRLRAKGNMPPLPPGGIGIPYWGESLDYLNSWNDKLNPDIWYDTRKAKHGEIFKTHILGSPTVVVLGSQANKFVLTNENRLFRNSWPKSLNVLIGKHALINSEDADHKRMKRITHSVLGMETLKKSVARFERLVLHHLDSDWRSGQVVLAHHKVKEMLLSVAADFFLGLKAGEELETFRRNFHYFSSGLLSQPLDLPFTAFAKAKKARAAMISQFLSLIQLCRKSSREEVEDNFISMVLRTQKEGSGVSLSDEEIADNLMGIFTGGYDTTASALATILKHLSLSPHVLQELRKDCEKVKDKVGENCLTWNEIKCMDYLHNVIAEGLRIVAPINGVFKQAKEDVVYGGFTIPKGWKGFRKVDPDRLEFAHDSFLRGQKQLITCICQRRPNYHHGREQGAGNNKGSQGLNEGDDAIVEEIAQLKEEQESIDKDMEQLKRRLDLTEQRSQQMILFMFTVANNLNLISQMLQNMGSHSGGKKRRRVPYKEEEEGLMAELGFDSTTNPVIADEFIGSELIDGADCIPRDPNLIDSEVRVGLQSKELMGTCSLTDQHSGVSIDESGIVVNAAKELGDCNVDDILCWDEDLSDETEFANCNVMAEIALIVKSP